MIDRDIKDVDSRKQKLSENVTALENDLILDGLKTTLAYLEKRKFDFDSNLSIVESKLKKSTVKKLVTAGYSSNKVVRVGKRLGVHAIVTGNVTAAQNRSFGMLGVGRMNTVVQSVTMKAIGVKKADTLMIITINYKVGQNPHVAAEGIAMVLKAKLQDPTVDIKGILKQEQIG